MQIEDTGGVRIVPVEVPRRSPSPAVTRDQLHRMGDEPMRHAPQAGFSAP